jgi:TonB family protein
MARLVAGVVVVTALVVVSGVVRAQTPPQTPAQTEGQLLIKLTQNPNQVGTYLDLAKLYADQGRFDEAERMLQRAMTALQTQRQAAVMTGDRLLMPAAVAAGGDRIVTVGGAIKEPARIKYGAPVYPEFARAAGVTGVVILELTTTPSGFVRDAKVLRSVALLDQAAIDAVKQWQFAPTLLNGAPVAVTMTVTVNFTTLEPSGTGAAVSISGQPAGVNAITSATTPSSNLPVRVGGEIREPKKIRDVRPVYPRDAQTARLQGVVVIESTIDVYGNVTDAKLVRSAHELLDVAAMDAVRQWKYAPTTINGVPVSVIMTVTVTFTLAER